MSITTPIQPIIYDGVTTFIESVGRRQQFKYNELDVMLCTYTGPAAQAAMFKPPVNSPHPTYPRMICTASQIMIKPANVAEVQVTYLGIIQSSGPGITFAGTGSNTIVITDGAISLSPAQGSRDFQVEYTAMTNSATITVSEPGFGGQPSVVTKTFYYYSVGSQRINVRYVGTQSSVRYYTYPAAITGMHGEAMGQANFHILSQYAGEISIAASNVPQDQVNGVLAGMNLQRKPPPLFIAPLGSQVVQKNKYWFEITDIYGPTF